LLIRAASSFHHPLTHLNPSLEPPPTGRMKNLPPVVSLRSTTGFLCPLSGADPLLRSFDFLLSERSLKRIGNPLDKSQVYVNLIIGFFYTFFETLFYVFINKKEINMIGWKVACEIDEKEVVAEVASQPFALGADGHYGFLVHYEGRLRPIFTSYTLSVKVIEKC
jgi:hypothetical protein